MGPGGLSEDGPIAGLFEPRLVIYDFPLHSGKEWRQGLYRIYGSGFRSYLSHTSRAEGWEEGERRYRQAVHQRNQQIAHAVKRGCSAALRS